MKTRFSPDQFIKALEELKPPYYGRRAEAIMLALHNCSIAMSNFPDDLHSGQSKDLFAKLEEYMNTDGTEVPEGQSALIEKARTFSKTDVDDLKRIIGILVTYRR